MKRTGGGGDSVLNSEITLILVSSRWLTGRESTGVEVSATAPMMSMIIETVSADTSSLVGKERPLAAAALMSLSVTDPGRDWLGSKTLLVDSGI